MKPRHLKDWHKNELIEEVRRLRGLNARLIEQNLKLTGNDKGSVTTAEIDEALSQFQKDQSPSRVNRW